MNIYYWNGKELWRNNVSSCYETYLKSVLYNGWKVFVTSLKNYLKTLNWTENCVSAPELFLNKQKLQAETNSQVIQKQKVF